MIVEQHRLVQIPSMWNQICLALIFININLVALNGRVLNLAMFYGVHKVRLSVAYVVRCTGSAVELLPPQAFGRLSFHLAVP